MLQTVEFAAFLSTFAGHVIEQPGPLPKSALAGILALSNARFRNWARELQETGERLAHGTAVAEVWTGFRTLAGEIFATELLMRVWGAVLFSSDRSRKVLHAEPLARSLLLGQLDIRRRLLSLMVHGPGFQLDQLGELDRLRRKVDRWSDVLVGPLVCQYGADDFACNPERARDFGEEQQGWKLLLMSLRSAFQDLRTTPPAWSSQLQSEILGCFPVSLFSADGQPLSQQALRLLRLHDCSPSSSEQWLTRAPAPPALPKLESAGLVDPTGVSFACLRRNQRGK